MGLPTSRDETLTSASKLRPGLINKIQDCIISLATRVTAVEVVPDLVTALQAALIALAARVTALEVLPALVATIQDAITAIEDAAVALAIRVTALEVPAGPQTFVYPATDMVVSCNASVDRSNTIFAGGTGGGTVYPPSFGLVTAVSSCPLRLEVGKTITAWALNVDKLSDASVTLHAELVDQSGSTAVRIGTAQSNNTNAPGMVPLQDSGLSAVVQAGHSYSISFYASAGGDTAYQYQVTVT